MLVLSIIVTLVVVSSFKDEELSETLALMILEVSPSVLVVDALLVKSLSWMVNFAESFAECSFRKTFDEPICSVESNESSTVAF